MYTTHNQLKILIADDHPLMCGAISNICASFNNKAEIFHAYSYEETFTLLNGNRDLDLLLLDLNMPHNEGLDGLTALRKRAPTLPIIVMSASDDRATVKSTFDLGVRGYIHKSASYDTVISALTLILSGGVYISPEAIGLKDINFKTNSTSGKPTKFNQDEYRNIEMLTKRQREVLDLLSYGMSNKEIGRELGLTEGTVRAHLALVFKTLNVKNRIQAGIIASQALTQIS